MHKDVESAVIDQPALTCEALGTHAAAYALQGVTNPSYLYFGV